jgi:uncharacterized protein YkwD
VHYARLIAIGFHLPRTHERVGVRHQSPTQTGVSVLKITGRSTRWKAHNTVGVGKVVLALTAALLGDPATASADPDPTLLDLINQQRAQANPSCQALNPDPQLQAAADRHARDFATNGWRNDDNDSDGTTMSQRIQQAGHTYGQIAENQARNTSAQAAVNGWMSNTNTQANMLNCTLADAGTASSGSIYVAVFARPR